MGFMTQLLGSRGNDVRKVQAILNDGGYALAEDGIFGEKTEAAVKDFQEKNDLAVDGIVGNNTWAALMANVPKTTVTGAVSGANNKWAADVPKTTVAGAKASEKANTVGEGFDYKDFTYDDYQESDVVTAAKQALEAQMANKPGAYQSQWQSQLDEAIKKILNREKFSYDFNGDALYQQYKDKYIQQGKMAMADTMGQAAAMTGGYGNSYAATVGNQAYQQSLQKLNDIVPELYQMAYDRYNQEGQDLYNQYALLGERENADYGRYRDSVADWEAERDYLTDRYEDERNLDYSKYIDDRNYAYGQYSDDKSYAYNNYRDGIADAQWQATFDESMRQYNEQFQYKKEQDAIAKSQWQKEYDLAAAKVTGTTGGDTPGGDDNTGNNNGGISASDIKKMQAAIGVDQDGKWGPKSTAAAGGLTLEQAYKAWQNGTLKKAEPVKDKTWDDYSDEEHEKNTKENGGSFYSSVLTDLKQMKKSGKSNAEVNKYLSDLVGHSYITRSEYLTLYNKYRDGKLG